MEYKTNGKTLQKVITETRQIIDAHKIEPKEKIYYFKKYQDCTAILTNKKSTYYVNCLFDVYGPFKTIQACLKFRQILNINNSALRQAEVNSWSKEGANFLRPQNALL